MLPLRFLRTRSALSVGFIVTATALTQAKYFSNNYTPAMAERPLRDEPQSVLKYVPRHRTWPYSIADMTPSDTASDSSFYDSPRFVTHIDDDAIADLRDYYDAVLPRRGRILDLCSSWISHLPTSLSPPISNNELRVVGVGMSQPELEANPVLNGGKTVKDLNVSPQLGGADLSLQNDELLDASVCVVSIDYLRFPVEVLQSVRRLTRRGGSVHLVISNRCFPTKAVSRWLKVDENERLLMVGDYLHFSGWEDVEIVTLSDGQAKQEGEGAGEGGEKKQGQTTMRQLMRMMGMDGRDPLWVVRAVNGGAETKSEL